MNWLKGISMPEKKPSRSSRSKQLVAEAMELLQALGFAVRQRNEVAGYTLLSLLDLRPGDTWDESKDPLRGITPIIDFIADNHGIRYAPNTRETIRDEAVKFFVEYGLVVRNPDQPDRPTTSGKTVYQIEPGALSLIRQFRKQTWGAALATYRAELEGIRREIHRMREHHRIPIVLPGGGSVLLSPGGQNPLIKAVIEQFCTRFSNGGTVVYIGDTENKFIHMETDYLAGLGVEIGAAAKIPDVIVHDVRRNWLLLIEAVTSAGPVDGKRRKELKELFSGCKVGLVFVTAFETRHAMQGFLSHIAWESEVWIAEDPDHLIHFNGERFLGPYPDAMPTNTLS